MEQPEFSGLRVLLVGAKGHAGANLRAVLNAVGVAQITTIEDTRRALELLCSEGFDAVFVEDGARLDRMPFTLAARQSKALLNPMVPVFAVYSGARKRDVETARDLGVHDVLARPISPKTIKRKLAAAIAAPRPFIVAPDFFGPDRRAKTRDFGGDDRRSRVPKRTKVQFYEMP